MYIIKNLFGVKKVVKTNDQMGRTGEKSWNNGKSGAKLDLTSSTTPGRYILGSTHIEFH